MGNYTFLFPFEKIEPHSNILIYGAGNTGIEYIEQILITKYCNLVGVVDKKASSIPKMVVPVYEIKDVRKIDFDYIVIAMKNPTYNEKIIDDLKNENVPIEKIIFVGGRKNAECVFLDKNLRDTLSLAFLKKGISLAVQIPHGIGDIIISKRFVKQMLVLCPGLNIDIYCSNEFAEAFYDDTDKVNAIITPHKATFYGHFAEYDIAVSMRYYLTFYGFKYENVKKYSSFFADKVKELYIAVQKDIDDCSVNERLHIVCERAGYANKSLYQYPGYYEDVLDIKDDHVDIPLNGDWADEFKNLHFANYITVNYGNGIGSTSISKQWPLDRFTELVKKIREMYPKLKIVQIGAVNAEKINGCNEYLLGENLELVKYVLLNSHLHIDIEGGLVHMATQLGTKCVVLFGPTSMIAFGYKQNINIRAGDCHNCYGVESNVFQCARHLAVPVCMEAITVNRVFDEVVNYLNDVV